MHQPVPDVAKLNFPAISTSLGPLGVPPQGPRRPQLSCFAVRPHRSCSWQKKNPIRWAGGRIIEVMIGAVQRQLIVMEAGGTGRAARLTELSGGALGVPD